MRTSRILLISATLLLEGCGSFEYVSSASYCARDGSPQSFIGRLMVGAVGSPNADTVAYDRRVSVEATTYTAPSGAKRTETARCERAAKVDAREIGRK